jgi:rhodanese-related sulfurtransferase
MTISIEATELSALMAANETLLVLDVRKLPAYEEDDSIIAGADWRDPARIDEWGPSVDATGPVICYCVHGHEVSQGASATLRARGLDARYLIGGIDGWRQEGGALAAK